MIAILPFFKKFQVLPNGYTRLIGPKSYLSIILGCYKKFCGLDSIIVITDIPEVKESIWDVPDIVLCDIPDGAYLKDIALHSAYSQKNRKSAGRSNELIAVFNVNNPLLDPDKIYERVKEYETAYDSCILIGNTQSDNRSSDTLSIDEFMNSYDALILLQREMHKKAWKHIHMPDNGFIIKKKNDWILADRILRKKRIIFRANGYRALGMGHIYNCITLAYSMYEHDTLLVLNDFSAEGIRKVKEAGVNYRVINEEGQIDQIIDDFKPDIWVNDCLDTEAEYIRHLKSRIHRVVTIEDLGTGTKEADAVINALYDDDMLAGANIYNGWRYVCLRDEFQVERSAKFSDKVKRVLIMFGGTDPSNYNRKIYPIIERIASDYKDIEFDFIVGIGYKAEEHGIVTQKEKGIYVLSNVQRVTKYMQKADIAITSQGRTIYELAAMGVPSIVLSQNTREATHRFARMENGFLNLGTSENISGDLIHNTLDWLINTPTIRKDMYDLMMKHPLRSGLHRVKEIILDDIGNGQRRLQEYEGGN